MTSLKHIRSPRVLVDLDRLEANIERATRRAEKNGKQLWPMLKTHKSSKIAKLQEQSGVSGFTCGTISEAEMLANFGISDSVHLGYPLVDPANIERAVSLIERGLRFIFRVDCHTNAKLLNQALQEKNIQAEYTVKIDVGYHRHGVPPSHAGQFVKQLASLENLKFVGIVTHPGQLYHSKTPKEVKETAQNVASKMEVAVEHVKDYNTPKIIGIGSTPTFPYDLKEPLYTHLFPGNYVYYDRQQVHLSPVISLDNCALTILTTVISRPAHGQGKIAILNVGTSYLEKRSSARLKGYGQVVGHFNAYIQELSQEVAKVVTSTDSNLNVGEKVQVIPNHACFANNAANLLIGHRNGTFEAILPVDGKPEVLELKNGATFGDFSTDTH